MNEPLLCAFKCMNALGKVVEVDECVRSPKEAQFVWINETKSDQHVKENKFCKNLGERRAFECKCGNDAHPHC